MEFQNCMTFINDLWIVVHRHNDIIFPVTVVQVFPGNFKMSKSQLPSNKTVNIHSKWVKTRQTVLELFKCVARGILLVKVVLERVGEDFWRQLPLLA